jgi:hypothetical protein
MEEIVEQVFNSHEKLKMLNISSDKEYKSTKAESNL